MFYIWVLLLLSYSIDLFPYGMIAACVAQQQLLAEVNIAMADAARASTMVDPLVHTVIDQKQLARLTLQEAYAIDTLQTEVCQGYNNHIPVLVIEKNDAITFSSQVIEYSDSSAYSRGQPSIGDSEGLQQKYEQSILDRERYSFKTINFEYLHAKALRMNIYRDYVLYTKNSAQAHDFVDRINKYFTEFNAIFDRAQSMKDYQDAYGLLQKIESIIDQIEKIEPLSYVLVYDIFHAIKHIELPLLDLFLGNKQALVSADHQQIAWALHGYYKKMVHIFGVKQVTLPPGKLRTIVDDYYRRSIFSKCANAVSHYARKGYRDLIISKKRVQYQQLLEQQAQFLNKISVELPDNLSGNWHDRYAIRQRAADQSLADKAFYTRTYHLQEITRNRLEQLQLDPQVFMQLRGNALQHALQDELVRMANVASGKQMFSESTLHFAHTGAKCNQIGQTEQAWKLADISWMLFDHLQAAGEGAIEGFAQVFDFLKNPKVFIQDAVITIGKACYDIVCYRVYCLEVEVQLMNGDQQAIIEAALLDLHTQHIKEVIVEALSGVTTRNLAKEGAKFAVNYKLTAKLFRCLEMFLLESQNNLIKPLLATSHPISIEIPRVVYETTFDPATRSYVVDAIEQVSASVQELKQIMPVEQPSRVVHRFTQEVNYIAKGVSASHTLEAFKSKVKAAATLFQKEPRVQQAIQHQPILAKFPKKNACHKDDLLAELKAFHSERFVIDNHSFLLDKRNLKHILSRHHSAFWDGSIKDTQTFIPKDYRVEDIIEVIKAVFNQNRDIIIKNGTNNKYQIKGIVDEVEYIVGIKKGGLIGQFYIPERQRI